MKKNIFAEIPKHLTEELIETLEKGEQCRIERIVSRGHTSPEGFWYDQEQDEFVILLQGEARLCFENRPAPVNLQKGDYLIIKAHHRHRVEWTSEDQETVWLAVHY